MSTAKQITPSPSISSWYKLVEGSYLDLHIHSNLSKTHWLSKNYQLWRSRTKSLWSTVLRSTYQRRFYLFVINMQWAEDHKQFKFMHLWWISKTNIWNTKGGVHYRKKGLSIDVLLFTNSMEPPMSQVISEMPTKGHPFFISCCNWSMLNSRGNLLSQYIQLTVETHGYKSEYNGQTTNIADYCNTQKRFMKSCHDSQL